MPAGPPIEYRLLGPVEAAAGAGPIRLGGRRQRALLALLLLDPGRPIPVDRLIDELWQGAPPAGAATTLRSYVSRLRSALGRDAIAARPPGYALDADPGAVDARRFERLLSEGRDALGRGAPGLASDRLGAGLALWRGPALADVAGWGLLELEARRLDELRLACLEERIDADLELGRHAALVAELERLVEEQPYRERLRRQLVLALYRADRQADALAAHRRARATLLELGLEPGEELRTLERAVLRHEVGAPAPAEERHNLPQQATSFVGREREAGELETLLREHRLVTLTGIGGAGKTRLALEVAARQTGAWPDGVWLVDLTAIAEPGLVSGAVAAALGVEQDGEPLHVSLRRSELLLVLDNCEHVARAGGELADGLLAGCPNLRLLATSRVPLGVAGEAEYALDPLELPDEASAAAELERSPSVRLFLDRGRAVRRDLAGTDAALADVARVCRELDGLPLAIELAAAQIKTLSLDELAARLDDRFRVLGYRRRIVAARHRTLRATMDWSYELLADDERTLLRRLAVFAGGFTLAAVAAVCSGGDETRALELLGGLVDASLVRADERYRLLETVRQYAGELLAASGEEAAVRRAHARHLLAVAEAVGLEEPSPAGRDLLPELANVRAALDWCLDEEPGLGLQLAVAFEGLWTVASPLEAVRRLERLLERVPETSPALRARAYKAIGSAANPAGLDDEAEAAYARSLELFRELADEDRAAVLLLRLGYSAFYRGDTRRARALGEESLAAFAAAGRPEHESQSLGLLGEAAYADGDAALGLDLMARSADLAGASGFPWWRAKMLTALADGWREQGEPERAAACVAESVALSARLGDRRRLVRGLARLARLAAERGDPRRAGLLWGAVEAEETRGPLGDWESSRAAFEREVLACADEAFAAARERGRTLPLDDVLTA